MIDRYLAHRGQRKAPMFEVDFTPDKAARELVFFGAPGTPHDALTIVFSPWHAPTSLMPRLARRLLAGGSDVLIYSFHDNILNDNPTSVRASFEHVAHRAASRTNELAEQYDHAQINLLGFSLGNIALSMAAEEINTFNEVTMVVPGSNLLDGVWYGIRTQRLREALEAKGATYEGLHKEWQQLAPQAHIDSLEGHDVHVILAKGDRYIPYNQGEDLVLQMQAAGIDPELTISRHLGHSLTIARYAATA